MSNAAEHEQAGRPVALVTGVGRTVGIGAGIASQLAASGWNVAFTYWHAYDERMDWGPEPGATAAIAESLTRHGAESVAIEADLATTTVPGQVFDAAQEALGASHCSGDVSLRVRGLGPAGHHGRELRPAFRRQRAEPAGC